MTPGTRHGEWRASEGHCEACKCAPSCACPSEDGDFSVFLSRGHLGLFATLHQPGCQGVTCAFGGWLVWVWRCHAWPTCLSRGVYKGVCCVSTSLEWEGTLRFISFLNNICQAPTLCQMFLLGTEDAAESKIHPQPLLWLLTF